MTTSIEATAFGRGLDPVLKILLPGHESELMDFKPDDELVNRIEILAEKSNEGSLTPEEMREYQGYRRANKIIALLQSRVRQLQDCEEDGHA